MNPTTKSPPRPLSRSLPLTLRSWIILAFTFLTPFACTASRMGVAELRDLSSLDELRKLIDSDKGSTRLVLLLSPT
jgi:hypothetical protein